MQEALLHGVFPDGIEVGVEVFVNGRVLAIGFLNLRMGSTLEVHVQVLGQVPAHGEVAVPEHLAAECDGQAGILGVLQVALLQLRVVACQLRVERNGLRQIVQSERLGEVYPLGLALHVLERFQRLVDRRVGVAERPSPLDFAVIDSGLADGLAVLVAVTQREVGRVVGHGVALGLDTHTGIGD